MKYNGKKNEAPRPKGHGIGDFARYRERPAVRRWTAPGKVPVAYTKLLFALRKAISELLKAAGMTFAIGSLQKTNCGFLPVKKFPIDFYAQLGGDDTTKKSKKFCCHDFSGIFCQ